MKILLTGAAGQLGTELLPLLSERGQVLATVDLDQIIGVGITKSITGGDCHCLIYLIDGKKPLRIASGTEQEIRRIRTKMDDYVTPAAERLAAKMAQSAA